MLCMKRILPFASLLLSVSEDAEQALRGEILVDFGNVIRSSSVTSPNTPKKHHKKLIKNFKPCSRVETACLHG